MFRKAAIRLTLQYSMLILAILALFSVGLYQWIDNLFDKQYIQLVEQRLGTNDDMTVTAQQRRTVEAAAEVAVEQFRTILIVVDGVALAVIPLASYAIAKRSLWPLIEANESQRRFITNASHELRTPLAVMSGEFELALKRDRDIAYYKKTIVSSKEELERLNRLTNQLMELQRLENNQNKATLKMRAFSPIEFMEGIHSSNKKSVTSAGFNFINESDRKVNLIVGNEDLLRTALDNLISNAVKYSKPKSTIKIGVKMQNSRVALFVENIPKIKISEQDTKQIFERFWQPKDEQKKNGFGLGLAIVKAILDVHRSEVKVLQKNDTLRFLLIIHN
ncbi:MAG: Two-component sensor histidine kinase [Candidatus Saccharibacteria bacterium]|nr:Two-component sensor histidine kinase [Candidatus Saccharibacteria bacterium]